MKTKSQASKARVSKVPLKSSSMFSRAINKMANLNEDDSEDSEIVLETPQTPPNQKENNDVGEESREKVLVCNGKDCEVAIKQSNLNFLDYDKDNFLCPHCLCKCAKLEFEQVEKELIFAKKNAQLAEEALTRFLNCSSTDRVERVDNKFSNGNCREGCVESCSNQQVVENEDKCIDSRSLRVVGKSQECGRNDAAVAKERENVERKEVGRCGFQNVEEGNANGNFQVEIGEASGVSLTRTGSAERIGCQEKKSVVDSQDTSVDDCISTLDRVDQELDQLNQLFGQPRPQPSISNDSVMVENGKETEQHRHSEVNYGSQTSKSHHVGTEKANPFTEFRYPKSVIQRRDIDAQYNSASDLSTGPVETTLNQEKANIVSVAQINHHKPAKCSSNPALPASRRRKLVWTDEEEEMLEKAVKVFASKGRKNFSWISILDYGRHVFNETRTPVDLKDKWKSMGKEGWGAK
ncbi:Trf-like [Thalictrum thalictroides]|uniref:Trf-like n=1 Tax=Thalictrum thalictroides TaxID=46969 RepID=A0A7J6VQI4_THATH|nr:Trf-like [Thalictrum thalictroides]